METKFNFKSQICTTREQSLRLLSLGLKKETADMRRPHYSKHSAWVIGKEDCLNEHWLPAWSLGRLWELYWSNKVVSDCLFGCGKYMNPYAKMIAMIEYDIEEGTFNKDYLDK